MADPTPVYKRQPPDWVAEVLSDRQLDALPPPMLWAKLVQAYTELTSKAVTVALGMHLRAPVKGSTFYVGIRELAADLHRSKAYVAGGLDELEAAEFLRVHTPERGRRTSYTLTLPGVRPVGHIESKGVRSEGHIESDGKGVSQRADRVSSTADKVSHTADGGVPESGHIELKSAIERDRAHAHAGAGALEGAPRRVREWDFDDPEGSDPDAYEASQEMVGRIARRWIDKDRPAGGAILWSLEVVCFEHDWDSVIWDQGTCEMWALIAAADAMWDEGGDRLGDVTSRITSGWDPSDAVERAATGVLVHVGRRFQQQENTGDDVVGDRDDVVPKSGTCVDCGSERHRWCSKKVAS